MSGAASNNRGKWTEQAVARWFRANGFEQCERTVRTGYRVAARSLADGGDLQLCPGAIVSVKALRPVNRAERAVPGWLVETEAQRVAAGAEVALLVVRRDGTGDVGEWWAWLPVIPAFAAVWSLPLAAVMDLPAAPVRLLVADACRLLRTAGYGESLRASESTETVRGVSEYPDSTNGALAARPAPAIGYGDEP